MLNMQNYMHLSLGQVNWNLQPSNCVVQQSFRSWNSLSITCYQRRWKNSIFSDVTHVAETIKPECESSSHVGYSDSESDLANLLTMLSAI